MGRVAILLATPTTFLGIRWVAKEPQQPIPTHLLSLIPMGKKARPPLVSNYVLIGAKK